jgi:hypothetical protein
MPPGADKPLIVISYAHADEPEKPAVGEVKWLSFVIGYLRPAIKHGAVDLWVDRLMLGGAELDREIEQKLRACDIFLLLVSHHSLSSDYVVDKEIAIIRERQAKGENVHFYPLLLMPTPTVGLDLVRDKNLRRRDGKPLSDYSLNERYRHMSDVADEIAEIAGKVTEKGKVTERKSTGRPVAAASSAPRPSPVQRWRRVLEESFEKWLATQERETVIAIAARAALRVAPLVVSNSEYHSKILVPLTSAVFRASALARAAAKYPARADDFATAADDFATADGAARAGAADAARAAYADAAAARAAAGAAYAADAAARAAEAADAARDAARVVADAAAADVWDSVQADAAAAPIIGPQGLADLPLWPAAIPDWANVRWARLVVDLPKGEDWDVWIDWYENRLHGGSRGEDYELVFASVPQEEWDKGPAAANAWIREYLPPSRQADKGEEGAEPQIQDRESLESWLIGQNREVAVAIAARAALRVVPLLAIGREQLSAELSMPETAVIAAAFRATAVAWTAARYTARGNELREPAAAAFQAIAEYTVQLENDAVYVFGYAAAAVAKDGADASLAQDAASAAAIAVRLATAWEEVRADAVAVDRAGATSVVDMSLWSRGQPELATDGWAAFRKGLPKGQNWEVWINWYEERLRGGSRGEDYELVFARVPQVEWDKGPAAANAWIKAHLPKVPLEASRSAELPAPLPNLEAPFAYGWNAALRVALEVGGQNLPFYTHFSSEEDHRKALDACRLGGERLLKSLRTGRYNARLEYGEALEYYLDDLPKTAGAGNILLANDQVRILHAMFLADAVMLPEGFASRLKSVVANQFALNAFYDLVQRHNEAVSAGNWSRPFPLDEARSFFGAVDDNTPRWFEPQVEQGLRQVEQAEPPAAAPSEPVPAPTIEPPPLPAGTPDAQASWQRQMATAANALWETFLKGQDMPVAVDEWRAAAEELGAHVRPILDFLRAQKQPKR